MTQYEIMNMENLMVRDSYWDSIERRRHYDEDDYYDPYDDLDEEEDDRDRCY